jgi:hypothetical protein
MAQTAEPTHEERNLSIARQIDHRKIFDLGVG